MVGNSFCNDETNNADCNYDGGDCCVVNANTNSCSECVCHLIDTCAAGYHPLVGNGFCDDNTNIAGCYDGGDCCSNPNMVGDGICHDETNHLGCNYDGGDCCLIVRISLNNVLLNHLSHFIGDYEISIMPNGQTSWINGDYAIWHNSGVWLIGDLAFIGELTCWIYAFNDFFGLTDDDNEWNYWDGNNWSSPTDQSDVQITCVNN